jgi:hypothetical protein
MLACGDNTLATSNQNIVQTLGRIIEVEKSELMSLLTTASHQSLSLSTTGSTASAASAACDDGSSIDDAGGQDRTPAADTPASFICPISHMIFEDPVIAADDNTCA